MSNTGSGYTGDPDSGEGGWGWAHFGSPRANDGDGGGDEGPSLGHHGGHGDSGHGGRPRGGSGQIGSVDDQQYEGGGYGWTNLGAPRATPGSVSSAGVTLTPDSAPWPSGPRRFGRVLIGAALLALPIGALVLKFGGQSQPDAPVIPAVVISAPALPPTAIARAPSTASSPAFPAAQAADKHAE